MHRSGTSCLAGCLERCGLFLGDVSRSNDFNARGNHERAEVVRIHEQILAANGGSWMEPPERIIVSALHRRALARVAAGFPRYGRSGLKDPRTLLLLDTWLQVVGSPVVV